MSDLDQVLIIDDHPLFREALASVLRLPFPDSISREAGTLDGAVNIIETEGLFDIVVLGLSLAGVESFDGLKKLRTLFPCQPLLLFAGSDNTRIVDEAIACGAAGFLPRMLGPEVLSTAICTVLRGDIYIPDPLLAVNDDDDCLVAG